jgi:hypothetical protein
MGRLLLTRVQVAEMLGTSTMTVIRLQKAGDLTGIKLTDRPTAMTRYQPAEVEALVEKRLHQAKQKGGAKAKPDGASSRLDAQAMSRRQPGQENA